jgi:hypothetical protein
VNGWKKHTQADRRRCMLIGLVGHLARYSTMGRLL